MHALMAGFRGGALTIDQRTDWRKQKIGEELVTRGTSREGQSGVKLILSAQDRERSIMLRAVSL